MDIRFHHDCFGRVETTADDLQTIRIMGISGAKAAILGGGCARWVEYRCGQEVDVKWGIMGDVLGRLEDYERRCGVPGE